jgi:hypothetical protein
MDPKHPYSQLAHDSSVLREALREYEEINIKLVQKQEKIERIYDGIQFLRRRAKHYEDTINQFHLSRTNNATNGTP